MPLHPPRPITPGPPRPVALIVLAVLAALALTACTSTPLASVARPRAVRAPATTAAALHRLVTDGAPGAAALATRDGRLAALPSPNHRPSTAPLRGGTSQFTAVGVADLRSGRKMGRLDRFRAGSLTKTLVATVVLQLVGEGRLALDDPAAEHLPPGVPLTGAGGANDLRRVTIRQLLDHTSGLFNYTEDPHLAEQLYGAGFVAHRYDRHTPTELLRIALAHPPTGATGGSRGSAPFSYSNTNYLVLGLVIQGVTGHPYAEELRRRILAPFDLRGTSFPGDSPTLPAPHGRGYSVIDGRQVDSTALNPSRAGAAGEMITTLVDLNRFFAALLGGRLLAPRQMAQLRSEKATHGAYGLGVYATRLPCGVTVWGHNGDINGSYAQTAGTADGRHLVSYRVNTDDPTDQGDGTAVLTAEFCPSRARPD
ncbi:beta-lactamase family protein [Streptomyces yunnanensis]|uniref:Beta-lactamase family protein n=1 Tax=Streptomyces yunnanensis TaxID=156453 RepID=A0ABY8AAK1_9ACTN|nr:serine hydrolase domain-containing protein [Streptomyces yunnanensis]WEB42024.1 beta-lactamase family protein [Streptomyces yunnanensis]